jgi:hypothetical protein
MRRLSRRTLLRGLLGGAAVTVGLPWLEIFLPTARAASDGGFPRRFGLFFWGNGIIPSRWTPEGTGKDYTLSDQLMPLAPFRDQLTVVTGMRVAVPNVEPHFATAAGFLSGRPIQKNGSDHTFAGPSIDQIIAEAVGGETRFASLELGAKPGSGMSHVGPNAVNPPETSPFALFERVFGGGFTLPGDTPKVDPTLALRRSVLDAVMGDIERVQGQLGAEDAARLEAHLDGVRALEKRLAKLEEDPPNLAACALPATPKADYPDIDGRPQLRAKNEILSEITAFALACDQTRVFSNWFTAPVNNNLFEGAASGHHQLTHDEPGDQPQVHAITLQCIEAFAAQIAALAGIKEGDGTLLDHMVVLGTSDVSLAKTHSPEEFPIALVGSLGGRLHPGIHYRSPAGENASKVPLTIARAMGIDLASFGDAEGYDDTGLGAIEA